jgi:hypothetical protein
VGDRKIILNFYTEPTNVKSNQTMKHVTVKMEVSDIASVRCLPSEFFHARNGNIDWLV